MFTARGGGGSRTQLPSLTVKERIQLHLFDYSRYLEAYEVPVEVTQEGIAQSVGIRVSHVPQYIRPLAGEGLVEERTSHVQHGGRRRRTYFLTAKGRSGVVALRAVLLEAEVLVRSDGETRTIPLAKVYQEYRRGSTLLGLLQEMQSLGSIGEQGEPAKAGLVDFTQEAPKLEHFYGRTREVATVLGALETARLIVVTGMAGLGKTSLAVRVCDALRGKRSVFWRQVRAWDTAADLGLRLAAFLRALGRVGLQASLTSSKPAGLSRVEELLSADLAGMDAVLVFDDVHQASEDAQAFFGVLLRALSGRRGVSALLLSRTVPGFYSRREVDVDRMVVEIPLGGLDPDSATRLLADAGIADPLLGSLVRASGGSPLFLKLVASRAPRILSEGWTTVDAYIGEEIEPALDPAERAVLQTASFYHLPVPAEALSLDEGVEGSTVQGLRRKGLLVEAEEGRLAVHDSIREHFQRALPLHRRKTLASRVGPWLAREAEAAATHGRQQEAVALLGNAVAIESDAVQRRTLLERLGDLRRLTGDLQASSEAYQTALGSAPGARDAARLHHKIAGVHQTQGHLPEAEKEVEAGLSFLPEGPSPEAAWLLYRKGHGAYLRNNYEEALTILQRATEWLAELPRDADLSGLVANLRGLMLLKPFQRFDEARAEFLKAAEAFEAAGDRRGVCLAYNNLALVAVETGRPQEALNHLDRSAAIAEAAGDYGGRQNPLQTKAWCLSECLGDYVAAEALYKESFRLAKLTHQRKKMLWLYHHFAELYRRQGRLDEARETLEYFLRVADEVLDIGTRVEELSLLVRVCILGGDLAPADGYLKEARRLAGECPSPEVDHFVAWADAALRASRGDREGARTSFARAHALAKFGWHGEFLLEYGRFLASVSDKESARELLGTASAAAVKDGLQPIRDAAQKALRGLD